MPGEFDSIVTDAKIDDFDEESMFEEIERESHGNLDYYRRVDLRNHPAISRKKEVAGSND